MQEYQITVLQQQLQTVKDLKRQYEAAHSSFVKLVPDLVQLRSNTLTSAAPSDAAALLEHDIAAHHTVAANAPGTQNTTSGACRPGETDDLLNAMNKQVEGLGMTAKMEQTAAFVLATELDRRDACAVLTGKRSRYYVHQSTVSLGRTSVYKGKVRPISLHAWFVTCQNVYQVLCTL